jgi:hypothetical protein
LPQNLPPRQTVTQSYRRRNKITNLLIDSDEKCTNEYWPLSLQFNPFFISSWKTNFYLLLSFQVCPIL